MQPSSFHFLPPFFAILAVIFAALVFVLQIGILGYAYERMGISRWVAFGILLVSLLGASVNIPVAEIKGAAVVTMQEVGNGYVVPVVKQWPDTQIAINVGGALVPALLSVYFIVRHQIYGSAALGVAAVAAVVHALAVPVPQMGISVPILIPPIVSAVVALLLSREHAAPLAYISGCLGTLIGADLLNLNELAHLGASIASIGGAGTFDGVFLTGILAVVLAASPRIPQRAPREPHPQVLP